MPAGSASINYPGGAGLRRVVFSQALSRSVRRDGDGRGRRSLWIAGPQRVYRYLNCTEPVLLNPALAAQLLIPVAGTAVHVAAVKVEFAVYDGAVVTRSEEHTSELQSLRHLV